MLDFITVDFKTAKPSIESDAIPKLQNHQAPGRFVVLVSHRAREKQSIEATQLWNV